MYPAPQSEGERLPLWPKFLLQWLTGVFYSTSWIFPGLLSRGVTPITRKEMTTERSGCSGACARLLEHKRERERIERMGPGGNQSIICPWKDSVCEDGEFGCCLCLRGLVFPSQTKEAIQRHQAEQLLWGEQNFESPTSNWQHWGRLNDNLLGTFMVWFWCLEADSDITRQRVYLSTPLHKLQVSTDFLIRTLR